MNKRILIAGVGLLVVLLLGVGLFAYYSKPSNETTQTTPIEPETGLPSGSLGGERIPGQSQIDNEGNLGNPDAEGSEGGTGTEGEESGAPVDPSVGLRGGSGATSLRDDEFGTSGGNQGTGGRGSAGTNNLRTQTGGTYVGGTFTGGTFSAGRYSGGTGSGGIYTTPNGTRYTGGIYTGGTGTGGTYTGGAGGGRYTGGTFTGGTYTGGSLEQPGSNTNNNGNNNNATNNNVNNNNVNNNGNNNNANNNNGNNNITNNNNPTNNSNPSGPGTNNNRLTYETALNNRYPSGGGTNTGGGTTGGGSPSPGGGGGTGLVDPPTTPFPTNPNVRISPIDGGNTGTGRTPGTTPYTSPYTMPPLTSVGIDPTTITDPTASCLLGSVGGSPAGINTCINGAVTRNTGVVVRNVVTGVENGLKDPNLSIDDRLYSETILCALKDADYRNANALDARILKCAQDYQNALAAKNNLDSSTYAAEEFAKLPPPESDANFLNCLANLVKNNASYDSCVASSGGGTTGTKSKSQYARDYEQCLRSKNVQRNLAVVLTFARAIGDCQGIYDEYQSRYGDCGLISVITKMAGELRIQFEPKCTSRSLSSNTKKYPIRGIFCYWGFLV